MKTVKDIGDAPYTDAPLGLMFHHQKNLMRAYTAKERLPVFPLVDINALETQDFFRQLMGFFDEEVREAYTEIQMASEAIEQREIKEVLGFVRKFNEEIADTLHFLMEIMVFANMDENDVDNYFYKLLVDQNLAYEHIYSPSNPLVTSFTFARMLNHEQGYHARHIQTAQFGFNGNPDNWFEGSGNKLSIATLGYHEQLLFKTGHQLGKARNLLKNKYWKASRTETDVAQFQMELMGTWIVFFQYLEFIGSHPEHIYQIYFKKNQVNLDRIEQGW